MLSDKQRERNAKALDARRVQCKKLVVDKSVLVC